MSSFNSREFRQALGSFGTGVTIVTARDAEGNPIGMTASSFNSVSMEPPLILWSVTKTARSSEGFRDAAYFAVHVLAAEQQELSNSFARAGEDKFASANWSADTNGVPVIEGVAARFDCRAWQVYEGGDHWIIVGEVLGIAASNRQGLVFANGTYALSTPIPASGKKTAKPSSEVSPVDSMLIYNLSRAYRQLVGEFHAEVLEGGLSISAWRILSSLHGGVRRDTGDLSARTFLDSDVLLDQLDALQEQGLVNIQDEGDYLTVAATEKGHQSVQHLFALSAQRDIEVLGEGGDEDLKTLIALLNRVIQNTSH